MTGLTAILGRELQQTVRRKTLHRLRLFGALSALGISLVVLLPYWLGAKAGSMGHDAFLALVWLAFAFSLLSGPMFASDMVSEEKREGTLGLLMLTPLRSHQVVAGKLIAVWMPGLQVMLAIVPVFSLVFFMGGVTGGELGRALLVLATVLFMSLCLALACSCVSTRALTGLALTTGVLIGLAAALPFYNSTSAPGVVRSEFLAQCSPTEAIRLVADTEYTASSARFWSCLGIQALLGVASMAVGGLMLARMWRTDDRMSSWRSLLRRSGRTRMEGSPAPATRRLLETVPFVWLADRLGGGLRWTWVLVLASLVASLLVFLDQFPGVVSDFGVLFLSFYCGHGAMKLWVAWHASRRLAEDRRSGVLEMMLCLPMEERDVWGGWLGLLKRRLFWPVTILLGTQAFLVSAGAVLWDATLGEGLYLALVLLVMGVFLVADCYTLSWSALANSLSSRSSAGALAKTIVWVLFLPILPVAAILAAGTPVALLVHAAVLGLWVALSLAVDLFHCARAHGNVEEDFRASLARAWRPPPDASAAWKALSGVRKRLLARMGGTPPR